MCNKDVRKRTPLGEECYSYACIYANYLLLIQIHLIDRGQRLKTFSYVLVVLGACLNRKSFLEYARSQSFLEYA